MIARHQFLLDDLSVRAELSGNQIVRADVAEAVIERQHFVIGLAVIDRTRTPDANAAVAALGQHIVTGGTLCLIGWTPSEATSVPPAQPWYSPDGRLWVPLIIQGTFLSWLCLGRMADAV